MNTICCCCVWIVLNLAGQNVFKYKSLIFLNICVQTVFHFHFNQKFFFSHFSLMFYFFREKRAEPTRQWYTCRTTTSFLLFFTQYDYRQVTLLQIYSYGKIVSFGGSQKIPWLTLMTKELLVYVGKVKNPTLHGPYFYVKKVKGNAFFRNLPLP